MRNGRKRLIQGLALSVSVFFCAQANAMEAECGGWLPVEGKPDVYTDSAEQNPISVKLEGSDRNEKYLKDFLTDLDCHIDSQGKQERLRSMLSEKNIIVHRGDNELGHNTTVLVSGNDVSVTLSAYSITRSQAADVYEVLKEVLKQDGAAGTYKKPDGEGRKTIYMPPTRKVSALPSASQPNVAVGYPGRTVITNDFV